MSFNYLSLTINMDSKKVVKSATELVPPQDRGQLYYKEVTVLRMTFVDNTGTAVALGASDTYVLALDSSRRHVSDTTDLMAYSDDTLFDVSGDWSGSSRASGELAARVDCGRALFSSRITETDGDQACFFQVRATPNGETNTTTLVQDTLDCWKNVINTFIYELVDGDGNTLVDGDTNTLTSVS
jgi:hypothetical protein